MNERGRNVYRIVCDAPDTQAAMQALESWAWLDLWSYLLLNYSENGISGQLLGIVLVEGAVRYAAKLSTRPPEGGTANGEGIS